MRQKVAKRLRKIAIEITKDAPLLFNRQYKYLKRSWNNTPKDKRKWVFIPEAKENVAR